MLALSEKQMLIQALGQCIVDEVTQAVAPLKEQMANMQKAIGDMPIGRDGRDGKDADPAMLEELHALINGITGSVETMKDWTREYVQGAFDALPKAEKGEKGDKGDKGDPGERGEDGKNGRDGIDGTSVALADVERLVADLVAKAIGDLPVPRGCVGGFLDRRGHLFLSFSDGSNSDLGEVVGRDGTHCDMAMVRAQVDEFLASIEKPKDGKDGLGFDDLEVAHDGRRLVTFKFVRGENAKVFNMVFPVPLYVDVWRAGHYENQDIVQRDGSLWLATKDTETMPGTKDSDWKLCAKRGQDGKDGKPGERGPEGKKGRDGRDLTKMGPDGSKW